MELRVVTKAFFFFGVYFDFRIIQPRVNVYCITPIQDFKNRGYILTANSLLFPRIQALITPNYKPVKL